MKIFVYISKDGKKACQLLLNNSVYEIAPDNLKDLALGLHEITMNKKS